MITLEEFKEKLKRDSITITGDEKSDGINIITIDSLPRSVNKIRSNRRTIYEYGRFMIKSADKQKFCSEEKSDIDELKLEILAVRKFKEKVPMLEKIAIVKQDSEKIFLIEELLVPYEKFKKDDLLKNDALSLVERTRNVFNNGDFKLENIVYDPNESKLLFTDVFPSEKHLMNMKE